MAIGDIDIIRVPIEIDPNGNPDTAVVNVAAALMTPTAYNVSSLIVRDPGVNSTKAVLVIVGQKKT